MDRNVCGLDRLVRFVFGPLLLVAAVRLANPGSRAGRLVRLGAALWGVEITLTAMLQWCPLNYALGIDTCERSWMAWYREIFGPAPEEGAATANGRPVQYEKLR